MNCTIHLKTVFLYLNTGIDYFCICNTGVPRLNLLPKKRVTKPKVLECETVVVSSDEEEDSDKGNGVTKVSISHNDNIFRFYVKASHFILCSDLFSFIYVAY